MVQTGQGPRIPFGITAYLSGCRTKIVLAFAIHVGLVGKAVIGGYLRQLVCEGNGKCGEKGLHTDDAGHFFWRAAKTGGKDFPDVAIRKAGP